MRSIDLIMSDPNIHRVICTDFGATLDLMAAEKDNCSINNHAVICICLVSYDWRKVKFKKEGENGSLIDDETIINECDKWIFFGDTIEKGKKNDYVTHDAVLKYIVKYYDDKRISSSLLPIPINIVHTDNCPTQYKCRQNFLNVATFSSLFDGMCQLIHKFAQKYRFKGSWDAVGKHVKDRILNNELSFCRCEDAWNCYLKLRDDLVDDEKRRKLFEKLDAYERDGDCRCIKNTTYTTRNTYIGFVTENKEEYDRLCADSEHEHIAYTDRTSNQPDMIPLKDTLLIAQVTGNKEKDAETGKWSVTSSYLPCSCLPCRTNPSTASTTCYYKHERNFVKHVIKIKGENEIEMDDLGLLGLTNDMLRKELNERGIETPKSWTKPKLVLMLTEVIGAEAVNDDQDPVEIENDEVEEEKE
jgi:hypothetical protein